MAKRTCFQKIKSNRSYTVEEAANVLLVGQQTVRAWTKAGLPTLSDRRPILILGSALRKYLKERAVKAKQPIAEDEFYCMSCKAPRKPMGMMVDFVVISDSKGRIVGICDVCEGTCSRIVSRAKLPELSRIFDVAHSS